MKIRLKLKEDPIKSPEDMIGRVFGNSHVKVPWKYTHILDNGKVVYQFVGNIDNGPNQVASLQNEFQCYKDGRYKLVEDAES
jgi:hypothetical protein